MRPGNSSRQSSKRKKEGMIHFISISKDKNPKPSRLKNRHLSVTSKVESEVQNEMIDVSKQDKKINSKECDFGVKKGFF